MTESTKTANEAMQELIDNFTLLAEEAENRRKTASTKWEIYKVEFADGEKHAYEEAGKKLKAVLNKM